MTVRGIWLLTLALFIGVGVGLVWWPASQTVAALHSAAAGYYDEASKNEEEVRQAGRLHALERRVVADLRTIAPMKSNAQATAALLQLLSAEQKSANVVVKSVLPQAAPAGETARITGHEPFDRTDVEIALTGAFADVLRFVSEVSRHGALLDVHEISMTDSGGAGSSPKLAVTLHATLYRFRGTIPEEK